MEPQAAASFLDELRDLPGRVARPQTFMEIGGYPHYENVCSNFLAFFLDPEGPHGLGSLFLDALAALVGTTGAEGGLEGSVSVEREVITEAGNRIDILRTSDSQAVLIENKIHAAVANPFGDYSGYLDGLKDENGEAYGERIKVLLTLHPSKEGAGWGFVNVTHAGFADAVRSSLGHHVSAVDARYLTLMLDFLNTLENLGGGTRMDQGYVELLAARSDEVARFLEAVGEVRGELRAKPDPLEAEPVPPPEALSAAPRPRRRGILCRRRADDLARRVGGPRLPEGVPEVARPPGDPEAAGRGGDTARGRHRRPRQALRVRRREPGRHRLLCRGGVGSQGRPRPADTRRSLEIDGLAALHAWGMRLHGSICSRLSQSRAGDGQWLP